MEYFGFGAFYTNYNDFVKRILSCSIFENSICLYAVDGNDFRRNVSR